MMNIAHRGASGYAPENTRASFDRAIAMGADAVETDIRLTSDGHLVLIHDDTVDRTTDGHGPVAAHTLAELRALDAGSWFAPEFAGERIMTLPEFIDEVVPRVPALVEIKETAATAPTIASITGAGIVDRVGVISFEWASVVEARQLLPELRIGFLTTGFDHDTIRRCADHGLQMIDPPVHSLTPELVTEAHAAGLVVGAWGVFERQHVDRLFETGADGAVVNWPDWIPGHQP